eukprot:IDg23088t1
MAYLPSENTAGNIALAGITEQADVGSGVPEGEAATTLTVQRDSVPRPGISNAVIGNRKRAGGNLGSAATPKARKTRAGSPNYNEADVNVLLDVIQEVLPLGAHHWKNVE